MGVNVCAHSCHAGTQVLTLFGLTHNRVDKMMPKLEAAAVRLMATVRKASSYPPESFTGNLAIVQRLTVGLRLTCRAPLKQLLALDAHLP